MLSLFALDFHRLNTVPAIAGTLDRGADRLGVRSIDFSFTTPRSDLGPSVFLTRWLSKIPPA